MKCAGCRDDIAPGNEFRCTDCGQAFHQACAIRHFHASPGGHTPLDLSPVRLLLHRWEKESETAPLPEALILIRFAGELRTALETKP